MARKYTLKQRAMQQAQTRQRIIEAAVNLHEEAGSAGATITAIAERAGVGRLTVYRHFPDEYSLLTECTSHYFTKNPPPDPVSWSAIADPEARLHTALGELYAYYHRVEGMLARADQEAPVNPVLAEVLAPYTAAWIGMRDILTEGWRPPGPGDALVRAAIGHALAFATWRSCVREQGLNDEQAITLMLGLVRCVPC